VGKALKNLVTEAGKGDRCAITEGDDIAERSNRFLRQIGPGVSIAGKGEVVAGVESNDDLGTAGMALDKGKHILAGAGREAHYLHPSRARQP
jgi:hypothetical protein